MTPVGYLFLIGGFLVIRQAFVGRAQDIPSDARDIALAFLGGDMAAVGEVMARRGAPNAPSAAPGGQAAEGVTTGGQSELLDEAVKLGRAAGGRYVWGATGPDSYDCSGLVWRAMRNIGVYDGPRFTTHVFAAVARAKGWAEVSDPMVGDVINWAGSHMGIVSGPDTYYSARSRSAGIRYGSISGSNGYFRRAGKVYRIAG